MKEGIRNVFGKFSPENSAVSLASGKAMRGGMGSLNSKKDDIRRWIKRLVVKSSFLWIHVPRGFDLHHHRGDSLNGPRLRPEIGMFNDKFRIILPSHRNLPGDWFGYHFLVFDHYVHRVIPASLPKGQMYLAFHSVSPRSFDPVWRGAGLEIG
jgi:hypothetical protein